MTQNDYNELIGILDVALNVFKREGMTDQQARLALHYFIKDHFFSFLRPINLTKDVT